MTVVWFPHQGPAEGEAEMITISGGFTCDQCGQLAKRVRGWVGQAMRCDQCRSQDTREGA